MKILKVPRRLNLSTVTQSHMARIQPLNPGARWHTQIHIQIHTLTDAERYGRNLWSAQAQVFPSFPWEPTGWRPATKQRTLENNRKAMVRKTLRCDSLSTSLPFLQKQRCVNEVVNNTDLLQIDVLYLQFGPWQVVYSGCRMTRFNEENRSMEKTRKLNCVID